MGFPNIQHCENPQNKNKELLLSVPAEQGDSKAQQKLSSQAVIAAKHGTHCVALPKV